MEDRPPRPRYETARFRVAPMPVYDVPAWFDGWFDGLFPASEPSLSPQEVARRLTWGKDVVYRALSTGALEGIQVGSPRIEVGQRRRKGAPPRAWQIPRPALRLWLIERNALNLEVAT